VNAADRTQEIPAMTNRFVRALGFTAFAAATLAGPPARAQLMDQLKGALGGGGDSGGGMPSVSQASPSNVAGVLQYCVRNNYLGGGSAASVKDSLVNKVGGGGHSNDSGFMAGNNGMLQSGGGHSFGLGGEGLKAQVTRKVCDQVLQRGKSML
jgi:Protein of unknown function (DUF2501)